MLNRLLANQQGRPEEALALLEEMAPLPLVPEVRATLWTSMLRGMKDSDLRRELYDAIPGLLEVTLNQETKAAFETALLDTFRAMLASGGAPPVIGEILDLATGDPNPLEAIASWAKRLEVRDTVPQPLGHAPGDSRPPEPSQPTTELTVSAPAVPADRSAHDREGVPPNFDGWVLSFRLPAPDVLPRMRQEILDELEGFREKIGGAIRVSWAVDLTADLARFAERIRAWTEVLPSPNDLIEDEREAKETYDAAHRRLGDAVDEIIAAGIRPDLLKEMTGILEHQNVLRHLPCWAWCPHDTVPLTVDVTPETPFWKRLQDPTVRRRALLITQLFQEFPHLDAIVLERIEPPAVHILIDSHLEEQVRANAMLHRRLKEVDVRHRKWVEACANRRAAAEHIVRCLDILDEIRPPRLSEATFGEILATYESSLESVDFLAKRAQAFHAAVSKTERNYGSADWVTLMQLNTLLAHDSAVTTEADPNAKLRVEHNFIDASGRRALLQISPVPGQPYGIVYAPLVLETTAAVDTNCVFEWAVSGPWGEAWPTDWPTVEPTELAIGKADWRPHPDKRNVFMCSFKARLHVRKLEAKDAPKTLSVRITVRSNHGSSPVVIRDLAWVRIAHTPQAVHLDWPATLNPQFVDQHPIGPQCDHEDMKERLCTGHSFAVVAPRRFGKSTLVEYFRSLDKQHNLVVPAPIVCTRFSTATGIDAQELWKELSENVLARTAAPLDLVLENSLPRATAFDSPRRAVAQERGNTLVILFDEAQALFGRGSTGYQFGDRLKDSIEHYWSTSNADMARVAFVFVGLPGLLDRAGSNLVGALRPFPSKDIDEDALNRLLLKVTNGSLQTTRGARLKIAQLSKNLLILREILDRLVSWVRKEGRSWISSDDVTIVELGLVRNLREGQEPAINRSLRDTFNDAETVNEWQPSPLYPIAVALAEARSEGLRLEADLQRKAADILTAWAGEAEADFLNRITFEPARIRERFRGLREAGVIKNNETAFVSPLLEAWLSGISRQGPQSDEAFYPAMLSSAMARVRRPPTLTPVEEGGQARVFTFFQGDETLAFREVAIESDEDRRRFVETAEALTELMKRIRRRDAGTEYVYDLRTIGLRDDYDQKAVQVYRWIDGSDLSTRIGKLPALAVAELGHRLAQALAWLHSIGVIHRDVQPKNAVLSDENMRPILIDFGFARLEQRNLKSSMASDFSAPEVRMIRPKWSKAADVWSLGMTLEKLLRAPDRGSELAKLLARVHADDVAKRPSAEALIEEFMEVSAHLVVRQGKDEFFNARVSEPAKKDITVRYYQSLLEKFRPRFEAAHLGLFASNAARAAEAADFLNQVVEAWSFHNRYGTESLGSLKSANNLTASKLVCNEIDMLHQLRTAKSHGRHRMEQTIARLKVPDATYPKRVHDGAQRLGEVVGLESLVKVVNAFFA